MNNEEKAFIPKELLEELRSHQDLGFALIGGLMLTIISALLWAVITVATEYQIGYMAIGVGILVGLGVRFFGAGIDQIYGVIGAVYALLACLLGNLFSSVGFVAESEGMGYLEVFYLIDFETVILLFKESFSPIDVIFYIIAIVEGYKFAFRTLPEQITEAEDLRPSYSNMRFPLVAICLVLIVFAGYKMSLGNSGEQIYRYENGNVQAKGNYKNGVEEGLWTVYYEDGTLAQKINYEGGLENGLCEIYFESGVLENIGNYKNGLLDGTWLLYNEDAVLIDSSNYNLGRLEGAFVGYYDDGTLAQTGSFKRDRKEGFWEIYYDDGSLSAFGSFEDDDLTGKWITMHEDGTIYRESEYLENKEVNFINYWDQEGNQLVVDGFGFYILYDEEKNVIEKGEVANGEKVGSWKYFYSNGNIKEEGFYVDGDIFRVVNSWDIDGNSIVVNGNGFYYEYSPDGRNVYSEGQLKESLPEGEWKVYYEDTKDLQELRTYQLGEQHGSFNYYYPNGNPVTKGNYKEGLREGEWLWYFESGELECSINYVNDNKQGDQIFFNEYGQALKNEKYDKGELLETELL